MNFYKLGVSSGATWFPSVAEPLRNQAGEIIAGVSMMRVGGARMYEIGALQKQEPVDPDIQGMVSWASDVGKGLLLFLGLFTATSVVAGALSHKVRK